MTLLHGVSAGGRDVRPARAAVGAHPDETVIGAGPQPGLVERRGCKRIDDAALLLSEHELDEGPGDHIDLTYLRALVYDDWGLWRTATGTLEEVAKRRGDIAAQARGIADALEDAPKGKRFRMRARIGERKRWYELPDETK